MSSSAEHKSSPRRLPLSKYNSLMNSWNHVKKDNQAAGLGDSTTCSVTVPRETRPAQPGCQPPAPTFTQAIEGMGYPRANRPCSIHPPFVDPPRPSPRRWLRSKVASARVPLRPSWGIEDSKGSGMSPLLSRLSPSERILAW
jgi:hypothetical protein